MDASGEGDELITPWTPEYPMNAPAAADSETTSWMRNELMDADAVEPSWMAGTLMEASEATPFGAKPYVREQAIHSSADADILITPWKQDHPMDGAKVKHIEVKRPTAGAPLAGVCSSLPAGPEVPELMTPAAGIRPYIPAGGWTAATIAALPGVRSGSMAADDPWIAHNRALAERAARA